ncbi:MAG: DUF2569 family protein, partial [Spirochaetota bacterium]|nr:DUF2569 family protein [Spirochaetota bacterium]
MENTEKSPSGLGGWLILPIIGLFLAPFRTGHFIITTLAPIFRASEWSSLTTPGNPKYYYLWAPLIIFELLGNIIIIFFAVTLIFFMFTKSHRL